MPLDPQAAAYVEQVRALGLPPISEIPVAEARAQYDAAAGPLFGPPDEVGSVLDADADGVPVRIYRPAPDPPTPGPPTPDPPATAPATVYLHGGGWVIGSLASHDPLCRTLAARSGAAVIAVDYRLAPEHPYPAAIDDAWTATLWAARRFGPLAVAGDSAGGQLAASVALRARAAGGPELALQVLIYPATSHSTDTDSYRDCADGGVLTAELMRWFWEQYVAGQHRAAEPDLSPLRAPSFDNLPPALVLTAEFDPLRDEGEEYARELERAGVPATLTRYRGLVHGFIRMPGLVDRAAGAIDQVAAALAAALGTTRASGRQA